MDLPINQIICGDCLEVMKGLPDGSVNAVITDPPYGINYQSARRIDASKRHKKIANDKHPFIWWLYDAYRILQKDGCLICFTRWDVQEAFRQAIEWAGFKIKSHIIWDRVHHGMGDLKASFAPTHDIIWFAVKDCFSFPSKRPKSVIRSKRISANKLIHPNEKPLDLMENLIVSVTKDKDLILDPFLGSGTTAVAALNTGRFFIGIEKEPKYVEIARQRVEDVLEHIPEKNVAGREKKRNVSRLAGVVEKQVELID